MTTKELVLNVDGCPRFEGRNEDYYGQTPTRKPARSENGNESHSDFVREACDVIYIANAPIDLVACSMGNRSGHKHPSRIEARIGGPGANGGRVFATNSFRCGVIALQGHDWAEVTRHKFWEIGIEPRIIERNGGSSALTLAVPNGKPGVFDLYTQRIAPNITIAELHDGPVRQIRACGVVMVGPMAKPDQQTFAVLRCITHWSEYSVWQTNPDAIQHPRFGEVASWFNLVIMNADEAGLSNLSPEDAERRFLALRDQIGEGTDLIVTNGANKGWAWLRGIWWPFQPPTVHVLCDTGAGDAFAAEFVLQYRLKRASSETALAEAMKTAALWVSGQFPPSALTPEKPELSTTGESSSWAELAL